MIKIKSIPKFKNAGRKKKAVLAGVGTFVLVAALCITTVVNNENNIGHHDGDVLVDSLSIRPIAENSDEPIVDTASDPLETSLVTSDDISELKNTDAYFEEVRATITMDRNQVISMLTDVIDQSESSAEKENATSQKLKIIGYMDQEKMVESLIETKGLPECLVLITDNAVNVTVNKQDLTQSDVAKICDIIIRETGRPASQIVIQSKF